MPGYSIKTRDYSSGLPKRFKIGPFVYRIDLVDNPTATVNEMEMPVFGMVSFRELKISIDRNLLPEVQWQCLVHELMHIIFEQCGLEDPGEGPDDALSYLLFQVLLDNNFLALESKS